MCLNRLILSTLLLLAACEAAPPTTSAVVAVNSGTVDPRQGKPGAPVVMQYTAPKQLQIGDSATIELQFRSTTQAGQAVVSLNTSAGLQLTDESTVIFTLDQTPQSIEVPIVAVVDGRHYLNISLREYDLTGKPLLGRSFAVPVQVGTPQAKTQTKRIAKDGERRIIEMNSK